MSPTYKACTECGKRALSVATRCPQCGFEFPARPVRRRSHALDFSRILPLLAVAGVLAVMVTVATAVMRRAAARAEAPSVAQAPELYTAMAAASPAAAAGERRFARTWTNVRNRRSGAADVVAVLLPGDTVLADSLGRGWWRVTLEEQVIGYVFHSTLVTNPPPAGP